MILSCLYNVPTIDGIALPTQETYSNAIWVEYAIKQGIVTREEVNASNADEKVKYKTKKQLILINKLNLEYHK